MLRQFCTRARSIAVTVVVMGLWRFAFAAVLLGVRSTSAQPATASTSLTCADGTCTAWVFENAARVRVCADEASLRKTSADRARPPRLLTSEGKYIVLERDGARWCTTIDVNSTGAIITPSATFKVFVTAITPGAPTTLARTNAGWSSVADASMALKERMQLGLSRDTPIFGGKRDALAKALGKEEVEPPSLGTMPRIVQRPQGPAAGDEARAPKQSGAEDPEQSEAPTDKLAKQPTDRPSSGAQPARRTYVPAPDDRSFIDVVGVGDASGFHCSGILVEARAVLTAAHCLPATRIGIGNEVHQFLATLDVVDTVRHPTLDVALLRLAVDVPVPLRPLRTTHDDRPPRAVVRIVGFGVDEPRKQGGFGVKRRVDVAVERWGCDRERAVSAGCQRDAELVVAGVGGRDTCWGDSGGPVLEPTDTTYRLLAITSRPVARGGAACGRGGIYVRVDAFADWLQATREQR